MALLGFGVRVLWVSIGKFESVLGDVRLVPPSSTGDGRAPAPNVLTSSNQHWCRTFRQHFSGCLMRGLLRASCFQPKPGSLKPPTLDPRP